MHLSYLCVLHAQPIWCLFNLPFILCINVSSYSKKDIMMSGLGTSWRHGNNRADYVTG